MSINYDAINRLSRDQTIAEMEYMVACHCSNGCSWMADFDPYYQALEDHLIDLDTPQGDM